MATIEETNKKIYVAKALNIYHTKNVREKCYRLAKIAVCCKRIMS